MIVVGTSELARTPFTNRRPKGAGATEGSVFLRHDHRECPLQATEGSLKFLPTK